MSNNKAFGEKLEALERDIANRDASLEQLRLDKRDGSVEMDRMQDELNHYKGRCQGLLRDIEMHAGAVNKLSNDQGSMGE